MTAVRTRADEEVEWEPVQTCPVCTSGNLRPWRSRCRDASARVARTLDYLICGTCRSRPMSPRPTGLTVGALYGASYAPYVRRRADASVLVGGAGEDNRLKDRLAALYLGGRQTGGNQAAVEPPRRVLDFGCGTSDFLDAARDAGWHTTGCDFSIEGVAGARRAGHEARVVEDTFWAWLGGQRFDAIRLNHVIEHLHHPGPQLEELLGSLAPGGVLHIVTPNPDGAACRLFRRTSLFFESVHLTLIPPAALTRAARAAGATAVDIVDERGSKDLWRSWQLHRGRATSYVDASAEPPRRWQRGALKVLTRLVASPDRYHAFISA